jgi:type 1 glutamine amidotransferase
MRSRSFWTAIGFAALVLWAARATAADDAKKTAKPIRVLLTVGGHDYEQEPFHAMFDKLPGVVVKRIDIRTQADVLKPGLEKDVDVLVMYDMCPGITRPQQENFAKLLAGGIGVVSLHHNIAAHPDWAEWPKIIGAKYFLKPQQFQGKEWQTSLWDHDQDVNVHVADTNHWITRGLKDFQIHDETYKGYWVTPEAKVLLTTDHPKGNREIAWVTQYGKSPVFFLQLGHDNQAWKNPVYPELLRRGIRWANWVNQRNKAKQ